MGFIRKRLVGLLALSAGGVLLTLFLALRGVSEGAVIVGAVGALLLFLSFKHWQTLSDARLICESSILSVPSAVIESSYDGKKVTEETVVSTFGILVGGRVYKWGCDGVRGVKLSSVKIDRSHICLEFGSGSRNMCIKLPHGLADKQTVEGYKERLRYETGVEAEITDWN